MKRLFLLSVLTPIMLAATWQIASAARSCPYGGYCPAGTCAQFNPSSGQNRQYACNVKNCSAANCPENKAKKKK
jgi:hypothetical protein